MHTVNTFSVETDKGVRSFHLHQGDISDSQDDVIVVSSHANPDVAPSGQVVRAFKERFQYDFEQLESLIVPRGAFGTYRLADSRCTQRTILLVRIPGSDSVSRGGGEPLAIFREALWTVFGSLAALEFDGVAVRSVSLPVLAGRRDYDIRETLTLILQTALRWLRWSRTTEEVSLYVFENAEFDRWFTEMDSILGRRYFESATDSVLGGLRQELVSLLKQDESPPPNSAWRGDLLLALSESKLRFQTLAATGRKLAESMTDFLLADLGVTCKGDLYSRITAVRNTKQVAPWVINYLLSLKDFGNESVHLPGEKAFRPKEVAYDDVLALLCSMSRIIRIWQGWGSSSQVG